MHDFRTHHMVLSCQCCRHTILHEAQESEMVLSLPAAGFAVPARLCAGRLGGQPARGVALSADCSRAFITRLCATTLWLSGPVCVPNHTCHKIHKSWIIPA